MHVGARQRRPAGGPKEDGQGELPGFRPVGDLDVQPDGDRGPGRSWTPKTRVKGGAAPWPQWPKHIGVAAMPTQHGPGHVSVSGGWMLSIGCRSTRPDLAFTFVSRAVSRAKALQYAIDDARMPVRRDVATDPSYIHALPTNGTFTRTLADARFRPTQADYLLVSSRAQIAMEDVMPGDATPAQAAAAYGGGLRDGLGAGKASDRD